MFDINSILNGSSGSGASIFDPAKLIEPLMPFIIALTGISILITILYIISVIDKWRQGRAIIETRDILREMNERDKARSPQQSTPTDQPNAGTASNDSTSATSASTS